MLEGRRRRMSGLTAKRQMNGNTKAKKAELTLPNGTVNGHLSPAAANKNYWREMSRSPSPLGLIPIHQKWRSFVSDRRITCAAEGLTDGRFTDTRFRARSSMYPLAS